MSGEAQCQTRPPDLCISGDRRYTYHPRGELLEDDGSSSGIVLLVTAATMTWSPFLASSRETIVGWGCFLPYRIQERIIFCTIQYQVRIEYDQGIRHMIRIRTRAPSKTMCAQHYDLGCGAVIGFIRHIN